MLQTKKAILFVSLWAFGLTLLKIVFGLIGGSVIVLASAIDSFIDMIISLCNYFALRKAESPSNKYFNYGFGKLEGIASIFESLFVFISGLYIIYKSVTNFISHSSIDKLEQSIVVMLISVVITSLLVIYLKMLDDKTNIIIKAEILHYKMDLLNNFGIVISLLIIEFSGFNRLDSIIGGILGCYICYNSYKIFRDGLFMLLDRAVDEDLFRKIKNVLDSNEDIESYHGLKSRISGNTIFLECHLVFGGNISLLDAHSVGNNIERQISDISERYRWAILIHLDPYDDG